LHTFRTAGLYLATINYIHKHVFLMNYCPLCKNKISFLFIELKGAFNLSIILYFLYYLMMDKLGKICCNEYHILKKM
jgi:hypothetical protein